MTISKNLEGDKLTVAVEGRLMKVTNINEMVREVLDVTGLMSVLTVE